MKKNQKTVVKLFLPGVDSTISCLFSSSVGRERIGFIVEVTRLDVWAAITKVGIVRSGTSMMLEIPLSSSTSFSPR